MVSTPETSAASLNQPFEYQVESTGMHANFEWSFNILLWIFVYNFFSRFNSSIFAKESIERISNWRASWLASKACRLWSSFIHTQGSRRFNVCRSLSSSPQRISWRVLWSAENLPLPEIEVLPDHIAQIFQFIKNVFFVYRLLMRLIFQFLFQTYSLEFMDSCTLNLPIFDTSRLNVLYNNAAAFEIYCQFHKNQ